MSTQFSQRGPYLCVTVVMTRILNALSSHDMEPEELADAAITCHATLSGGGYLRKLEAAGLIRVAKWKRNSPGAPTPIYSRSPGKSVRPPPVYSNSERTRRWKRKVGYGSAEHARRKALKDLVTAICS